jgi:DNA-binding FrmR family transcriptional regulator
MANETTPEQIQARLRRIEGQVRGIAKMLASDRACEDIVTQVMAVRASIDNVGALILDTHLDTCLDADSAGSQVDSLRETMRLWWRFAPASTGFGASEDTAGAMSPLPVPRDPS